MIALGSTLSIILSIILNTRGISINYSISNKVCDIENLPLLQFSEMYRAVVSIFPTADAVDFPARGSVQVSVSYRVTSVTNIAHPQVYRQLQALISC